jgi:hypothetical protein
MAGFDDSTPVSISLDQAMPFQTLARIACEKADVYGFARTVSSAKSTKLWRKWACGERFRP